MNVDAIPISEAELVLVSLGLKTMTEEDIAEAKDFTDSVIGVTEKETVAGMHGDAIKRMSEC